MRIFIAACFIASCVYGQAGRLQGPLSGFVFDRSSQSLRRIQGIPGAATVGAGVEFGFPVTSAVVAPRLDSAIILSADGVPHLFRLGGDAPVEVSLPGLAAADRVVFSPSGSAAALYAGGSVQVIRGLPDSATLAGSVSVHGPAKPQRPLSAAFAVSDDGAYLLYAAAGPVELIGVAGDSRKLMDAAPGSLAAFAPAGHDAAIVHSGMLSVIRDVTGA